MTQQLTPPTFDELHEANVIFLARIGELEDGLKRIDQLDVGVWPSWEMGRIARDLLGSRYCDERDAELTRLVQEQGA